MRVHVYVLGLSEIDELDGKLRSIAVRHTYVHIPDIIVSTILVRSHIGIARGCRGDKKLGAGA